MAWRLTLDRVGYSYPLPGAWDTPALSEVELSLEPGEVLCVAGANGSGKSTLAQVCSGLLAPSSGSVFFGRKRIDSRGELMGLRRKVGLLFQSPESQLFANTVEKDISFGPRNQGLRGDELIGAVKEASRMAGLDLPALGGRSPFTLSEGEKRRAALAGVLAMKPDILVLDEPFIGLDYDGRSHLVSSLERYRDQCEASIMIVTQELAGVWPLADRFALLSRGRLVSVKSREVLLCGEIEIGTIGLKLPQWGELSGEILEKVKKPVDPADPRAIAEALVAIKESGNGG